MWDSRHVEVVVIGDLLPWAICVMDDLLSALEWRVIRGYCRFGYADLTSLKYALRCRRRLA
jgi:hypothetical protein